MRYELVALPVTDIHMKPPTRSMHRFDIEVEDSHNYLVDGVVVHNSPEVTPGGRALKFYSSVRLDIRRIEAIKDGADVVGNRTRVKVVKNKCSSPFKQAEFDIMYGKGISREGSLLDVAVDLGFIKKSGAWFTYEGEQLGQGRENVKTFLSENPQLMAEIDDRVRELPGPQGCDEADDRRRGRRRPRRPADHARLLAPPRPPSGTEASGRSPSLPRVTGPERFASGAQWCRASHGNGSSGSPASSTGSCRPCPSATCRPSSRCAWPST